jgi:hypothetical protein
MLALVGPLAACGSTAVAKGEPATVAAGADCLAPEVLQELGLTLDRTLAARASHPAAPTPGRVPDDFVATGVLACEIGGWMKDGAGTWTAVTATTREGTPDQITALVTALGDPAGTQAPCAADGHPVALWLVDAMDRAVRPTVPHDACGAPTAAVLAALDGLTTTGEVDHPVELVVPAS